MKIAFTTDFKNVWILSLSCALAGSIMPLMVLVGSLVGTDLAPSAAWATTPIALMILGTALAVIPVSRSMQTLGRKKALWLFMGLGIAGCGLWAGHDFSAATELHHVLSHLGAARHNQHSTIANPLYCHGKCSGHVPAILYRAVIT